MINNIESLVLKITEEIRNSTSVAVVGLSGGADSTLVATLCTLALGKENVYGIHMPYNSLDMSTFNNRSKRLATKLGINDTTIPVNEISDAITKQITMHFSTISDINAGNARSRARMCTLYAFSHALAPQVNKKTRVIGTGNLSEDFIGYDTKGGDALCDLFPIGELYKSEVYQMLEYFVAKEIIDENMIDRHPSAGLWDGQTDEAELGYSYNLMEESIRRILMGKMDTSNPVDNFVMARHNANKHKHEAPPVLSIREFCD